MLPKVEALINLREHFCDYVVLQVVHTVRPKSCLNECRLSVIQMVGHGKTGIRLLSSSTNYTSYAVHLYCLRLSYGSLLPFKCLQVTETADFQKDLSLDSLDRVELVMAFEQEFSVEIPDDKADKLTCCADVARYIISESQSSNKNVGSS